MKRYEKSIYQGAVLDYVFNWTDYLEEADPLNGEVDTLASSAWSCSDADITLSGSVFVGAKTLSFVAGMLAGKTYEIKNTVITDGGRTDIRILHLTCL